MSDVESEKPRVEFVPQSEWGTLTIGQLYEQQSILLDRWIFLTEHNYPYAKDIKEAVDAIAKVIAEK